MLWRRQRDDAVLVQALGAVLALGGAVLWLGGVPVPRLLPWLAGFVVLTIAGERLELARLEMAGAGTPRPPRWGGSGVRRGGHAPLAGRGLPALGLVLLGLVAWLGSHDVARRTVRASGLPRFVAACLLAGYAWLATAGLVWALSARVLDGPAYDAAVHAVFVGFTLSMIMAHAPVILPAVLRVGLPYHRAMYVPAALLHASLLVRLAIGDARGVEGARQAGGALGAAAIALLIGVLVWSATRPKAIGTARATRSGGGARRPRARLLRSSRQPDDRGRGTRPRWRWHLLANAGVALWLVALLGVALGHRFVPEARWLLVHLLLLGAVTNAVLVWSAHFARALLKNAPGSRRWERPARSPQRRRRGGRCRSRQRDWTVVLAGALVVGSSVAAHGIALARQARAALPSRFGGSVHYYVAASACLPVGAGLGTVLAHGVDDRLHGRVALAHVAVNVIGWVGLTVLGTLDPVAHHRAHPDLCRGRTALPAGPAGPGRRGCRRGRCRPLRCTPAHGAGTARLRDGGPLVAAPPVHLSPSAHPESYAAWSVLAGVAWLVGSLLWLAVRVGTADDWDAAGTAVHEAAAPLAADSRRSCCWGADLSRAGGPGRRAGPCVRPRQSSSAAARPASSWPTPASPCACSPSPASSGSSSPYSCWPLTPPSWCWCPCRCAPPVPSHLPDPVLPHPTAASSGDSRAASSADVPCGLIRRLAGAPASSTPRPPVDGDGRRTEGRPDGGRSGRDRSRPRWCGRGIPGWRRRLASVVLAVAVGVAIDPAALGTSAAASAGVAASGETTTVRVEARGMRFHPASAEVPAGNRVVIEVVNRDSDVHDLALESGEHTGACPQVRPDRSTCLSSAAVSRAGAPLSATARRECCSRSR